MHFRSVRQSSEASQPKKLCWGITTPVTIQHIADSFPLYPLKRSDDVFSVRKPRTFGIFYCRSDETGVGDITCLKSKYGKRSFEKEHFFTFCSEIIGTCAF